jgi:V/A-type H+-transporting ATPase subunit B
LISDTQREKVFYHLPAVVLEEESMPESLVFHMRTLSIVGAVLRIALPKDADEGPSFGDLAEVRDEQGRPRIAQVVKLDEDAASLQVFTGAKGLTTNAKVRFLGHPPDAVYSANILGRVFGSDGAPMDGGPALSADRRIALGGPSVNPMQRKLASNMIRTDVPMIDIFNCLVESQKIPIFSVSGEPYNQLLARVGIQADADVVVFGGLGLLFDDYWRFRKTFEDAGVFSRTVMFVNQASARSSSACSYLTWRWQSPNASRSRRRSACWCC